LVQACSYNNNVPLIVRLLYQILRTLVSEYWYNSRELSLSHHPVPVGGLFGFRHLNLCQCSVNFVLIYRINAGYGCLSGRVCVGPRPWPPPQAQNRHAPAVSHTYNMAFFRRLTAEDAPCFPLTDAEGTGAGAATRAGGRAAGRGSTGGTRRRRIPNARAPKFLPAAAKSRPSGCSIF